MINMIQILWSVIALSVLNLVHSFFGNVWLKSWVLGCFLFKKILGSGLCLILGASARALGGCSLQVDILPAEDAHGVLLFGRLLLLLGVEAGVEVGYVVERPLLLNY